MVLRCRWSQGRRRTEAAAAAQPRECQYRGQTRPPRAPRRDSLIEIKITVYITSHKRYKKANMSTIAPQLEITLKGEVACACFLFAFVPLWIYIHKSYLYCICLLKR